MPSCLVILPRPLHCWWLSTILLLSAEAAHAATLQLAWNPNPEPNIAGYKIEFGNQPGVHPNVIDVGNQTSWQLSGLTDGLPYYIAVRAYNMSGVLSPPSVEVSSRVGVAFSVRGDFDGDRRTDPVVFRPSTGEWFWAQSTSNHGGRSMGRSRRYPRCWRLRRRFDNRPCCFSALKPRLVRPALQQRLHAGESSTVGHPGRYPNTRRL